MNTIPLPRETRRARAWTAALTWLMALGCVLLAGAAGAAPKVTPAELLAGYSAQAGGPASPERGQKFFGTNFGKDFGWSCASCHGADPRRNGRHADTEKAIKPLAPAAHPARFTDRAQVEFYFKLNCKDVVGRECTAAEKADLLSWLLTLKP